MKKKKIPRKKFLNLISSKLFKKKETKLKKLTIRMKTTDLKDKEKHS